LRQRVLDSHRKSVRLLQMSASPATIPAGGKNDRPRSSRRVGHPWEGTV
jgi:hypothetical protein